MSTNPFDDDDFASSTRRSTTGLKSNAQPSAIRPTERETKSQPPIYSARGVEWPLPPSLDPASYRKYRRASKALGSAIGISGCGLRLPSVEQVEGGESGGYGGLSGLMGRVLGGASTGAAGVSLSNDIEDEDLQIPATRAVLPPRAHCVSASNGWIVAAIECTHPPSGSFPSSSSSVGGSSQSSNKNGLSLTSLIPPLRLISRWNVRRGTSLGSESNQLVPLPPPVRANTTSDESSLAITTDPNFGRILHTFLDPTGCHVLISAKNGEAYYLHSTSKKVKKLQGFGPNVDGSFSSFVPGVSLGDVATGSGGDVQIGLTPGSYVTAVGWDRDRGTEGSTKRIILGTSHGELYEYTLVSPNATSANTTSPFPVNLRGGGAYEKDGKGKGKSSAFDAKAGELGLLDETEETIEAPVLLRRLNATTASVGDGGAVGGILFQRITGSISGRSAVGKDTSSSGYVIVLASTGGPHKHTRLHTFRSEPDTTLLTVRSAFSRQADGGGRGSFIELPGSVDFVDLVSCTNDYFALRTETGIYYGALERISGGGGISDAGLLSYDITTSRKGGAVGMVATPLSIGLTPFHFVTLNSVNEVKFVNRVARKVIQQERVDWMSLSQSASSDEFGGGGGVSELLMDVRRPDQIWLRKGRSLVHISSTQEDRDEWKYTLMKCIETAPYHGSTSPRAAMGSDEASTTSTVLSTEEKQIDSQFELAKSLCSNASQKAIVNAVRAEYHLSQGRADLAARYFAQCPSSLMPFADTAGRLALPMLGIEDTRCLQNSSKANTALSNSNMALITFLSEKLKSPRSKSDSSISTMLGSWITELHMHERERNGATKANPALLHQFLSSHVKDLDARTILSVISSHDISASECAGYSAASGDLGAAVDAALSSEDAKTGALDALRVLNDAPIDKAEHYYYKHALTLLSRAPIAASKSFLNRYTEGLKDTMLLPSFMQYERKRIEHRNAASAPINTERSSSMTLTARRAFEIENSRTQGEGEMEIRINSTNPTDLDASTSTLFVDDSEASVHYFEGVIRQGSRSRAIYNNLASLYAGLDDEGPLFRFLSAHVPAATDLSRGSAADLMLAHAQKENTTMVDLSYVLRTILRTGKHMRSAVRLYMGFGMRQQAVELALKVDPSLARELARQSCDKDEKKSLWLMIARSAADNSSSRNGKDVVARVVSVLKECGRDVLSIEDVLPFLPDFAHIDEFKQEICEALSSYSSKIEHYLKEMQECDQTCDALREELSRLRSVGTHVREDARCALTNKYVLDESEPFYAFPSGYVVLEGALKREIMPFLNTKQKARVTSIEKELSQLRKKKGSKNSREAAQDDCMLEELQSELDGLIAAECPLTGSVMVNSIDHGFLDDEDSNT